MFRPQPMERVIVAAPRDRLKKTIDALYEAKVLHLKEHVPAGAEDLPIGKSLPDAERASKLLIDLQGLKTLVPIKAYHKPKTTAALKDAEQQLPRLRAAASAIAEERTLLEQRRARVERALEELDFLSAAGLKDLSLLAPSKQLDLAAGYAPAARSSADAVVLQGPKTPRGHPTLVFAKKGAEALPALAPVTLSEWPRTSVAEQHKAMASEHERIRHNLADVEKRSAALQQELAQALPPLERILLETLRKSEAPLRFATSEHAFLVQGWVPKKRAAALREKLSALGSDIYLHLEPANDDAPTILKNPEPLGPFEFFLRLYSLPSAKEIDPTFFVFITFPIFYGVMLGDIGYGLMILLACAVLRFKMPRYKGLFTIFMVSAVFTMLFGWFFGEFFGVESIFGLVELHPIIHRLEAVQELLGFSLYFALFHLNAALLFGFANELRHSLFKAVTGKLGWIVFQLGGIPLIVGAFMGLDALPLFGLSIPFPASVVSYALLGTGILMIIIGERFQGVIEIPGLISNFLSYMRLAAIGLASASLALVINSMAGDLFATGGFFWVIGALLIGVGHAVNILLGMLDAFLQSLRLHYVETFPKFYHGGGEPYRPFGR